MALNPKGKLWTITASPPKLEMTDTDTAAITFDLVTNFVSARSCTNPDIIMMVSKRGEGKRKDRTKTHFRYYPTKTHFRYYPIFPLTAPPGVQGEEV